MLNKLAACCLTSLFLASTAYADTCPSPQSFTQDASGQIMAGKSVVEVDPATTTLAEAKKLVFTAARIKDRNNNNARVICQYEDGKPKPDIGAILTVVVGKPITATSGNWSGDDCATKDGDEKKCSYSH
ncbi:hypothetical protein N8H74_00510 [Pseudomonas sp. B2M1-30]|uniref:DUF3757 domain-containing protein n=1 Tax=Pseudomonas koreensis TaxID=198620 RepID=A0A9X2XE35_9PSED|nr:MULTISPECIES: hypothetical protein [Pseudomonas]MBV4473157.1 hypothetical protein [Pseudomonas botevensis]MCU0116715.1 hypothetical protein [Pseudomonas sp. B2M1-30]MCU7246792.1 hypothetical protein [Pseudomonas koreensis]MCU7260108.1 hypothetical protein [Pseudomonas koreensis]